MPSVTSSKSSRERVRAFRQRLREQGLRPVTVWLPDTDRPEFRELIRLHCAAIAADGDSADALAMIDNSEDWQDEGEAPDLAGHSGA